MRLQHREAQPQQLGDVVLLRPIEAEAPVPELAQADRVARPHTEHPARPEAGIRTQDALAHALAPDEGER